MYMHIDGLLHERATTTNWPDGSFGYGMMCGQPVSSTHELPLSTETVVTCLRCIAGPASHVVMTWPAHNPAVDVGWWAVVEGKRDE